MFGLGLAGCSQSAPKTSLESTTEVAVAQAPSAPATASSVVAPTPAPNRNIIYNGELHLAVDDFEQTSAHIERLATDHGAYLGTAHETRANGEHRQEMTFKVPPGRFLALVSALGKLGRIENKTVSSADVTADMLEAAASLRTKEATEAKYEQLLAATANPAELKRLEEQARQTRVEAAAVQAQLQEFGARSAWATLTLRYYQVLPAAAPASPIADFYPRFLEAFYRGWSILLGVVVLFTNVWPLLLLGGLGIWAGHRWRFRQQAPI